MYKDFSVVVNIPDTALNAALHQAANVPLGTQLTSEDLAGITVLQATSLGIENLEGMEYCSSLISADFSNNNITDLAPLSTLAKITTLNLATNRTLTSRGITPISLINNIKELNVSSTMIIDIDFIAQLSNLVSFSCNNCVELIKIESLEECSNLIYLDIALCSNISDISAITGLHQLRTLIIASLNVNSSNMESTVGNLINLVELNIGSNVLSSLTFLSNLISLKNLLVGNCGAFDLSPLASLVNLELLDAPGNNIYDISALTALPQLNDLELSNNYLTNASTDELLLMPALKNLSVTGNFITDLSNITKLNLKGVNTLFSFNFVYGVEGQYAFFYEGNLALEQSGEKTITTPLYFKSSFNSDYELVQNSNLTKGYDNKPFIIHSLDESVAAVQSTKVFTINGNSELIIEASVLGYYSGSTALEVTFAAAPGYETTLPLTTGNVQIPVIVNQTS